MVEEGSAPEDGDRFTLTHQPDIVAVLRQLARRPELITAYFNQGRESINTAVVRVDPDRGELDLDPGPEPDVNRRALAAGSLVCMARENNVSVRFRVNTVREKESKDGTVFRAPLPDSLYRLQRREYFRVPTAVAKPVTCRIPTDDGETYTFRAMDLSLGGIGIIDASMDLSLSLRDVFSNCEVEIPGSSPLVMDLEVRNISRHMFRDGTVGRRVGLAFRNLSTNGSTLLQRYLQRLQIAQRSTQPDFD
ncbi:c-di-GMP-binding flagellar brake protein YcgR, contains PilZNR and PilZ domains [Aquisalimonas asiatica]|uniref:Flagellar brake protein YcgR n=2 Tax=Aquisalimonas asiatica TaxID=406100 RepID=A0A1H8VGE2_9GAMM|nr:c-di-GMP-binding flagellar brake protein YcgR, contains PilZNR and PilZ domains [Aquisalimonas asiatica]